MNPKAVRMVARLAAVAAVAGVLALGMRTVHTTAAADATPADGGVGITIVINGDPNSNPWEG